MQRQIRKILLPLACMLLCCELAHGQLIFDDGQEHVLVEDVNQQVIVKNQSYLDV